MRRLTALVTNLPPGCALHRAEDPGGYGAGWTYTEELLATIAELIDRADRNFIAAHSKRNARKPRPIQITRPGELARRKRRRNATGEELAAMVGKLGGAIVPSSEAGGDEPD